MINNLWTNNPLSPKTSKSGIIPDVNPRVYEISLFVLSALSKMAMNQNTTDSICVYNRRLYRQPAVGISWNNLVSFLYTLVLLYAYTNEVPSTVTVSFIQLSKSSSILFN